MNPPSLILFDLGGVLIESAAFESLNRLLPTPWHPDRIKQRWLCSPAVRAFESGRTSATEFAANFTEEWQIDLSPEAFIAEVRGWPRRFFPGAKELIRTLSRHYRVGCLSNSNPLHWETFSAELSDLFDETLYSHQLGAVKPDPEIFLRALAECHLPANEVCFFDDCLANVQAAQRLGINAFLVGGFTSLIEKLHHHDLLPIPENGYFSTAYGSPVPDLSA
jgi:HAD superfamily hydrolase (TIGR01509 family)